jgi:hypothetical protein
MFRSYDHCLEVIVVDVLRKACFICPHNIYKRDDSQCFDVAAIHIWVDRLETDVCYESSGIDQLIRIRD